ncbi:MAG: alpha/beta hydrolase [Chloroflexi bacterium]|nr:alpha/beta hydrolase [Chloroflexota bacterium]
MPFASGIHYSIANPGKIPASRPPLILIHGAGGNLLSWHPYIRRLKNTTVYALDLPGHGETGGEGRGSIAEYTGDISAFMDALEIEAGVIAGLSMGSGIALMLALTQPQKVSALALLGGGAKLRVAKIILDTAGSPDTFASAVEMINANCFSAHAPPDLVQLSKRNMLAMRPADLLNDFRACNEFDVTAQLDQIRIPTLILCGAEDVMTPPKYSQFLKNRIPHAELHVLEKAGHMVTLEQPEMVAELLGQFMDKIPPLS